MAKKNLFKNRVPDGCGGGSVFFVSDEAISTLFSRNSISHMKCQNLFSGKN